jgi:iron complex outermembrane receptor protein
VLIRHNPAAYQNYHATDVYGGDVTASVESKIGKTNVGLLARGEHIYSSNLGKTMAIARNVPHEATDKQYTMSDQRANFSLFAEQNLRLGKWSASAGLLLNHNSYTGSKVNVYPGIDLAYYPNQIFKLYASANRAMRLPTFTDLYYHGPMNLGNPDLKPEQCTEFEFGSKLSLNSLSAGISYFYRNTTDAIDWILTDNPDITATDRRIWHTQNLTDLHTQGVSLTGHWDLHRFAGKNFWIRSVSADYSYMYSDKSVDQYESYYILDYLKHKFNVSLDHRIVWKIHANWKISWQDRNGAYQEFVSQTDMPYEAFWQIDLRLYAQTPCTKIFVEAANLSNQQHPDIGNITLPGRWVRAGITLTLGKTD